jgi:hypothetical protein
MTVSAVQPSEADACQATIITTGRIHPIHGPPCWPPARRTAAKSPGQTLAAGLSAMSVKSVSRARPQRDAALGVVLPRPNNFPDPDPRRNQPKPLEAVGDRLLLGENVLIERAERELCPVDGSALRRDVNAARL